MFAELGNESLLAKPMQAFFHPTKLMRDHPGSDGVDLTAGASLTAGGETDFIRSWSDRRDILLRV